MPREITRMGAILRRRTMAFAGILLCIPRVVQAAPPEVVFDLNYDQVASTLRIVLTPSTSALGCRYSLYGSVERKRLLGELEKLRPLLVLDGASGPSTAGASGLSRIRRPIGVRRGSAPLFFVVETECAGERRVSAIARIHVPYERGRRGVRDGARWLRELRTRVRTEQLVLERAFPNLSFSAPVDLQNAGDGTNRIFVVEQGGRISVFANDDAVTERKEFLSLSSRIVSGGERGLLGLAFHPRYEENGYFFVSYTRSGDGASVIARYKVSSTDPNRADPNSELVLLTVAQPYANHNGGQIAFGPDGYLYIALGDGGSANDPLGHGQNRTTLLGSILRIDVDAPSGGRNYGIPSDNPFVGNSENFREEIYAYGFRNPWRFSFDPETSRLWAGDVGQGSREEIDVVVKGGNFGWNVMEGTRCLSSATGCDGAGFVSPVHDYPRSLGASVTGGYVYRGSLNPTLFGRYVYGDFMSGSLWALEYDGTTARSYDLFDTELFISSFGVDEGRELYFLSYVDGAIYRFATQ